MAAASGTTTIVFPSVQDEPTGTVRLRELTTGIYPRTLVEDGLAAALE